MTNCAEKSVGMKLMPAGMFIMVSLSGPKKSLDDYSDVQARVTISAPYSVGVYEAMEAEYNQVTDERSSCFQSEKFVEQYPEWGE